MKKFAISLKMFLVLGIVCMILFESVKCPPPEEKKDGDKKDGDKKDGDKKDGDDKAFRHEHIATEIEAMKMPIIGHFLKFVATMYDNIPSYKMVDGKSGKQPDFCHEHECPTYKVLCKNAFYEVRKYEPAKWIHVDVKHANGSHTHMIEKAFQKLYGYISGENDKGTKIDMTVPVAVHVKMGGAKDGKDGGKDGKDGGKEGEHVVKEMCMKLYIPKELAKDPPKPKNSEVTIKESKEAVVYVKMFGGYVLNSVWKPKVMRFKEVLKAFNQKIDEEWGHVGATYDKPSILINRHNEIFLKAGDKKEDEKYCKAS